MYRWKSFWLGVLVMAFLGWAWVRSMNRLDAILFHVGDKRWQVYGTMGTMSAMSRTLPPAGWGAVMRRGSPAFNYFSEPAAGSGGIPPAFGHILYSESPRTERWFVADWCLMLLFLGAWSAVLAWRWRRQQRLTESTIA